MYRVNSHMGTPARREIITHCSGFPVALDTAWERALHRSLAATPSMGTACGSLSHSASFITVNGSLKLLFRDRIQNLIRIYQYFEEHSTYGYGGTIH